ncbi:MAG: glycosyltransferase [Pseudomonadota bacterium]
MSSAARLLIYSHDTFGLGHLRRCRVIAHHLVERYRQLSILILSGSPIIGSFDFKARVDFVRIPGVIKLRNGNYTPLSLHLDIEQTLAMRSSIIQHTAEIFDPHLFLVDKEPLGLRGEVEGTLEMLKDRGTRLVLGLRDVMDDPALLREEWRRKNVYPALNELYDDIWIYGLPEIFDPLSELPDMQHLAEKMTFTGYLRRQLPQAPPDAAESELPSEPYLLVTTGGGGDGDRLIDWVLSAYESDPDLPHPALLVFGPFMNQDRRLAFQERAANLKKVHAITFEARFERLLERAIGVVAMGGYNTFCEILSFGKPALIVPRTRPRREQLLRARSAKALGMVRMLADDGKRDPKVMAAELSALPDWQPSQDIDMASFLGGLDKIAKLVRPWLPVRTRSAADASLKRTA